MAKKITLTPKSVKRMIKEYIFMAFGVLVYSFAWVGIIIPANGVGGGASGISLLIYYATGGEAGGGIPIGVSYLIINALLLVLAVIIVGAKFGVKTLFCIGMASITMTALQGFLPENLLGLGGDSLLSAILGGAVSGLGIAIVLIQGGSTGGTDILAMIINKYRNISYGKIIMAIDFVIIGCSYFVFGEISAIIYGYILAAAFSYTADSILDSNKQSAQIFVTSDEYEKIADDITTNLHRGVTILDGMGWYTKKHNKVLLIVCRKSESGVILQHIKAIDTEAFISMGSVMGVYGKGFEVYRK